MTSRDSVVPAFVKTIAATAASLLPDVTVALGYQGNPNAGDYLWVHCEDPYQPDITPGSSSTQSWPGASRAVGREESGDITCVVDSWNGEGDVTAAMDRAYAILAPVASWLRTTTHADLPPGLLHAAVTSIRPSLGLSGTDARCTLVVGVHFEARI